jgi:hypothetical protein
MVDTNILIRNWLLASTAITSLLGTNANSSVYCGPDLPEHFDPSLGPAIQIVGSGGIPQTDFQSFVDDIKTVKVWADVENYIEARAVYCAIQDLLNGATNQSFGMLGLVTRCMEVTAPQDSSDPDTGWACCHGRYQILASANNTLTEDVQTQDGQTVAQYVAGLVAAEVARAEAAEAELDTDIVEAITTAETFSTAAVATETTRAETAEGTETSRAEAAEALLAPRVSPNFTAPVVIVDNAIGSVPNNVFTSGVLVENNTPSTNTQQQDPPALEFDGTYWTGLASAMLSVILGTHVSSDGTGTINSTNLSLCFAGHPGSVGPTFAIVNKILATAGLNVICPAIVTEGNYWNGSTSVEEAWGFLNQLAAGANPASVWSLFHLGGSGQATFDLSNSAGLGGTAVVVKVPTATALTSSVVAASTAYADSAVGVEKTRAQTAEALLAPKASPTFSGIATAPEFQTDGSVANGLLLNWYSNTSFLYPYIEYYRQRGTVGSPLAVQAGDFVGSNNFYARSANSTQALAAFFNVTVNSLSTNGFLIGQLNFALSDGVAAASVPAILTLNPAAAALFAPVSAFDLIVSQLGTPATSVNTTATTGGTLTPATYYYRVAAYDSVGNSLANAETSIVVPAGTSTNITTVNWGGVLGATGYKVYGRSTGAELLMATVVGQTATSWIDNGSVTPSGALPTANTTGAISAASVTTTAAITAGSFMDVGTVAQINIAGLLLGSGMPIHWQSATSIFSGSIDTGLSRTAAAVLAVGNGTQGDNSGELNLKTLLLAASAGAPTSAGTAGTAGQLIYFSGLVYFCSVTGAAGSATWNKLNMTAV